MITSFARALCLAGALRVAWAEKRTRRLAKRQRLRYYLAVCARLKYLERGMPVYRRLRVKWTCVQRWLALGALRAGDERHLERHPGLTGCRRWGKPHPSHRGRR